MKLGGEVQGQKRKKTNETLIPPTCVPTLELLVHNAPVNAVVSNDLSSLSTNLNAAYDFFLRCTAWSPIIYRSLQQYQYQCDDFIPWYVLRPFSFSFLPSFFSMNMCSLPFSEYFCTINVFSCYGEYVVPGTFFPFPIVFFYLVTTGWVSYISLYVSINHFNQSNSYFSEQEVESN